MKKYLLVSALSIAASGALAQQSDVSSGIIGESSHYPIVPASVSTRTRAEVIQETLAAAARGELLIIGEAGIRFVDTPSTRSRVEVLAEAREALRLGLIGGGEAGPRRQATEAEEAQIARAGREAAARVAHAMAKTGG
jgi:hypothetical protein